MALIITPAEIAAAIDVGATVQDVQIAQDVIEIYAGRDLSDPLVTAGLSAKDLRRCRLAVQWQTKYLIEHPDVLTRVPTRRASANGASIEHDGDGILAPLARRWLDQLSWSAGAGGVTVATLRPTLARTVTQPDPWVRIA